MAGKLTLAASDLLLHDWWLIKVSSGCHGERLGVGGFTSRESQGIRCFISAPIVKRHDAVTLTTADGITIMVNGHINKAHSLENGFSCEVCDHFVIGFPYYWEEFSVIKEPEPEPEEPCSVALEKIPISNGYKMLDQEICTAGTTIVRNNPDYHLQAEGIRLTRSKFSTPNNSNSKAVNQYTGRVTRSMKCKSTQR